MTMVAFDKCARHFTISKPLEGYVSDVIFSDNSNHILVMNEDGNVDIFAWPGLDHLFTIDLVGRRTHSSPMNFAKFGDCESLSIYTVVDRNCNFCCFDRKSYLCVRKHKIDLDLPENAKYYHHFDISLTCSCYGKYLAVSMLHKYLTVVDIAAAKTIYKANFVQNSCSSVDFLDDRRLVVSSRDRASSFIIDFVKDRSYDLPVIAPSDKVIVDRSDRSFYLICKSFIIKLVDKGNNDIVIETCFSIDNEFVNDAMLFNYGSGRYIAVCIYNPCESENLLSKFNVYDLNSYRHVFGIEFPDQIEAFGISPDSQYLAIVFRKHFDTYIAVAKLEDLFSALS